MTPSPLKVTSQPFTPLRWLYKCFHYSVCEGCEKVSFISFLSIKACICQGIDRNESRAPVIYRTIAQLINLMNHIIHPIIHETRSTIDHWRSISCSCEGQERLKVCRSLTRPELLFHMQRFNTRLVALWIFHAVRALSYTNSRLYKFIQGTIFCTFVAFNYFFPLRSIYNINVLLK